MGKVFLWPLTTSSKQAISETDSDGLLFYFELAMQQHPPIGAGKRHDFETDKA